MAKGRTRAFGKSYWEHRTRTSVARPRRTSPVPQTLREPLTRGKGWTLTNRGKRRTFEGSLVSTFKVKEEQFAIFRVRRS